MKRVIPVVLILLCATSMAEEATGYRIVHPDGTVEFTDDATRGGEEIQLRDVQTIDSGKIKTIPSRQQQNPAPENHKPQDSTAYTELAITSPRQDETVWFDGKGVSVNVEIKPALQDKHTVTIALDGVIVADGKSTSFVINEVYRGGHTLTAAIVDSQGKTLISSAPVTFYFRQRSKIAPQ